MPLSISVTLQMYLVIFLPHSKSNNVKKNVEMYDGGKKVTFTFFENQNADTNESRIRCTLLFTILKKLNRLAHMRCKKSRERTQEV